MNYDMYNRLVKNKRLLISLPLLFASLFLASQAVPSVHAQFTGKVCITASSTATSCDASVPVLGPFTAGQTFTVGVFIQGSDAMGGLDIYVKSDPTFVTPVSAALGSLIVTPSLTSICINGSAQTGACTVGTANGAGVAEVTTIEGTGTNECGGISPCSGMAFTITYSVVDTTPSTTLSYPSAAGCANTSVAGTTTCVLVADAIGTTLPETIQGASVSIVLPLGVICITSPSTATSCPIGKPNIPVTFGSTVTVGVFVQNSAPLGGFDIYVSVDSNYLHPIIASLGTLVASPSLTTVCVNGSAINGTCTTGTANGPDVVECSTVESSGANDPGTGLACTITYKVVGATPSTMSGFPSAAGCSTTSVTPPPPNVCVLVASNTGTPLPETVQGATFVQTVTTGHPVMIAKTCVPNPIVVGHLATCTGTVNDKSTSGPTPPTGQLTWTTDGSGSFNPTSCTLQAINGTASSCQTVYEPLHVGALKNGVGITNIGVIYAGDTTHAGSTDPLQLLVSPDQPAVSSAAFNSQTGQPLNSTLPLGVNSTVTLGIPVFDRAIMGGGFGFNGGLGVTGTLTYTLYPNGVCTAGTGTIISTSSVAPADQIRDSAPVAPSPAGTYSFSALYHNDTADNLPSAISVSNCEPFVVTPAPFLTHLHWTHHLSLSKTSSTQSWTATAANPGSSAVKVVVRIVGVSTMNPTITFDITCGVTCVSTASGGVNFTAGLTPVSVAAGATASFSFNQLIPGSFVNQKFAFTETLYWAVGTLYTAGNSKSGAFAVVP